MNKLCIENLLMIKDRKYGGVKREFAHRSQTFLPILFKIKPSLILDSFLFLAQGNTKRLNSTLMPPSYIIFKSIVSNILPIHVVY